MSKLIGEFHLPPNELISTESSVRILADVESITLAIGTDGVRFTPESAYAMAETLAAIGETLIEAAKVVAEMRTRKNDHS